MYVSPACIGEVSKIAKATQLKFGDRPNPHQHQSQRDLIHSAFGKHIYEMIMISCTPYVCHPHLVTSRGGRESSTRI